MRFQISTFGEPTNNFIVLEDYTCNYYNFEYNIDIDISEVRHAKIR